MHGFALIRTLPSNFLQYQGAFLELGAWSAERWLVMYLSCTVILAMIRPSQITKPHTKYGNRIRQDSTVLYLEYTAHCSNILGRTHLFSHPFLLLDGRSQLKM